ncbi:MAG TPA: TIGR00725 family protein [Methanoregula sp.]|nr:TIGR00725 family protein [Methanoregula sp.]
MQIAVIGAGDCTGSEYGTARKIGELIAGEGAVLVCGGLSGVMEAACRGAREKGGITVGILPGTGGGNRYLAITIRTGLGHARNVIVVQSADAVIAVGGKHGTLSEIAIALKAGIPVFGLGSWDIEGVVPCTGPEEAVARARDAAHRSFRSRTPRGGPESP